MGGSKGRVLHVNDYPVGNLGGAEVLLARTIELLRQEGYEAETFTASDLDDKRLTAWRYVNNPISRRQLAQRLESSRPDIVHLHNFYHLLSPGILREIRDYKRRRALRVVMTAHDYHLVCPNSGGTWFTVRSQRRQPIDPGRLARWPYLLFRKWDHRGLHYSFLKLLQHVWNYRFRDCRDVIDVVISPSRFLQALFGRLGQQAIVLPPPAPLVLAKRHQRSGVLQLIFVGRVEPEKGLCEFLQLLPTSFDGIFTIVGDGSDMARCRQTVAQRGLENRIIFLGRRPHDEVLDLIAQAHVLVLPSLVLESYAITGAEALAVGTNLLVPDRGAAKELVQASGVGYVFRPRNANSLAVQLRAIAHSHSDGTLNSFDVSDFLERRGEAAYVRGLLEVYGNPARS
jgi:glycosyltransferase involved in cell wall biosynthesis